MNVKYLTLAIAMVAANAHAGSDPTASALPQVSVYGNTSFAVDCSAERPPTLNEADSVLGTRSLALRLGQPQHLANIAHRECAKGAARVVFMRDAPSLLHAPVHAIAAVNPRP